MSALQRMKPITAAKRLGIYLPAAPEEFQAAWLTREELAALESDPPEWLRVLRREGADEAMTTAEIDALRADPPSWLQEERRVHQQVLAEEERVRQAREEKKVRRVRDR